jgi:flagella basal body P-ring formation protein FlgA
MRKSPLLIRASCALLIGLAATRSVALAEEIAVEGEHVTLAMILPALEGSELGSIDVAPAPLPGEHRVIRASDIKAKLKQSGRDARGLAIPRSVRVVRREQKLDVGQLDALVRKALAVHVAPCDVSQLSRLEPLTLGEGDFTVDAEPMPRKASGRTTAAVTVTQGERTQRLSVQAVLSCPAPVVMPGAQVRLLVISGAVRVSAPGVATQPGRVGDEIRVTNALSKRRLKGRVIDAQTVEVIQ